MINCPKCGVASDHPVKTWKLKKTSMALYKCSSCKAKWRSKLIVEVAIPSFVQTTVSEPTANLLSPTISDLKEVENSAVVPIEANFENSAVVPIEANLKNSAVMPIETSKPTSLFSGLKKFFLSIFTST